MISETADSRYTDKLKDKLRRTRIRNKQLSFINKFLLGIVFCFGCIILVQNVRIFSLKSSVKAAVAEETVAVEKYNKSEQTAQSIFIDYYVESMENSELKDQIIDLQDTINDSNATIQQQNNTIKSYANKLEIKDNYEYALYTTTGKKTDISIEDIQDLKKEASELGMTQDSVDVVLAIALHESSGDEDAKNPSSTAAGLCGILNSTGEFVWEDVMGNSNYQYSMLFNGNTNLSISLNYLNYLSTVEGNNTEDILTDYRGIYSNEFLNFVNNYLEEKGKSISTIKIAS